MLDLHDRKILERLAVDARISLKQLAGHVGLSSPSTSERLRKLEERGVIERYGVELNPKLLGHAVQAIVRIRPLPGRSGLVGELLADIAQVGECDRVTGDDCFVARVFVTSIEQLDEVMQPVADHAETSTAIVKSQVVRRRAPPLS
ncbi:MAG TPA: AsnC family transcriptional regulator [Xanthomonadaceae bacterium]|nr:AsnC family transcriptional regulator [Xanthomonadaceae bacterium]